MTTSDLIGALLKDAEDRINARIDRLGAKVDCLDDKLFKTGNGVPPIATRIAIIEEFIAGHRWMERTLKRSVLVALIGVAVVAGIAVTKHVLSDAPAKASPANGNLVHADNRAN